MKVLYVANYRNLSGYSQAAIGYILACDTVGIDIVPRHINLLPNKNHDLPSRVSELEKKSPIGCNVCIQHTIPDFMEYDGRFDKNIGIFAWEASLLPRKWVNKLNLMDEVWVINKQMEKCCLDSGIIKKIRVVNHTFDIDKYNRNYNIYEPLQHLIEEGKFLFYTIGEFSRRKNFAALLKAFHSEFKRNENVELIIKTNRAGMPYMQLFNTVSDYCSHIKTALRIYPEAKNYKKEYIIPDYMTEEQICELHNTCHCFVQPSYGEAWSCPAFDALGFKKTPIVTDCSGYKEYIPDELRIKCNQEICFANMDCPKDLYTGDQEWWHIDTSLLKKKMRSIYEGYKNNTDEYKNLKRLSERVYDFNYYKIGSLISDFLKK